MEYKRILKYQKVSKIILITSGVQLAISFVIIYTMILFSIASLNDIDGLDYIPFIIAHFLFFLSIPPLINGIVMYIKGSKSECPVRRQARERP